MQREGLDDGSAGSSRGVQQGGSRGGASFGHQIGDTSVKQINRKGPGHASRQIGNRVAPTRAGEAPAAKNDGCMRGCIAPDKGSAECNINHKTNKNDCPFVCAASDFNDNPSICAFNSDCGGCGMAALPIPGPLGGGTNAVEDGKVGPIVDAGSQGPDAALEKGDQYGTFQDGAPKAYPNSGNSGENRLGMEKKWMATGGRWMTDERAVGAAAGKDLGVGDTGSSYYGKWAGAGAEGGWSTPPTRVQLENMGRKFLKDESDKKGILPPKILDSEAEVLGRMIWRVYLAEQQQTNNPDPKSREETWEKETKLLHNLSKIMRTHTENNKINKKTQSLVENSAEVNQGDYPTLHSKRTTNNQFGQSPQNNNQGMQQASSLLSGAPPIGTYQKFKQTNKPRNPNLDPKPFLSTWSIDPAA